MRSSEQSAVISTAAWLWHSSGFSFRTSGAETSTTWPKASLTPWFTPGYCRRQPDQLLLLGDSLERVQGGRSSVSVWALATEEQLDLFIPAPLRLPTGDGDRPGYDKCPVSTCGCLWLGTGIPWVDDGAEAETWRK